MFNTLRVRLLISYLAIIATVLVIVTVALLAISASQSARILPALRQLNTINLGMRREIARLAEANADFPMIKRVLSETAAEQDVRIVIFNRGAGRVIYDSQSDEVGWTTSGLADVNRPPGEFSSLDPSLPIGLYRAPDGSRWLVISQWLPSRVAGRLLVLIVRPEPTIIAFFRETFLRPVLVAGLLALLLSVLLAILISRSVARPLQRLATASESIAQGEYDQHLEPSGPDEVRRVAQSFNTMASQVSAAQRAQRDFVANVSHDLKTPLTSIRGWSQALLDKTADSAEQQEQAARIIHDEAERMARMVEQLLDLAQIESGQLQLTREAIDLGRLAEEIQRRFDLQAQEKGVVLTLDAQPAPAIVGDHDRLVQVFSNLVDNALDHTPDGGRIHMSVHPYGHDAVEVTVQDSGSGISPEDLGRIFERFYQVDKSRVRIEGGRGTGLGLAIVKELVEAHGGRIIARSQVNQGTTFTVRLPIAPSVDPTLARRR